MRRGTLGLAAGLTLMVGALAFATAQQRAEDQPTVMAGPDLGFRIERMEGDRAVGTFVVKVKGQWVEALPRAKTMPAR